MAEAEGADCALHLEVCVAVSTPPARPEPQQRHDLQGPVLRRRGRHGVSRCRHQRRAAWTRSAATSLHLRLRQRRHGGRAGAPLLGRARPEETTAARPRAGRRRPGPGMRGLPPARCAIVPLLDDAGPRHRRRGRHDLHAGWPCRTACPARRGANVWPTARDVRRYYEHGAADRHRPEGRPRHHPGRSPWPTPIPPATYVPAEPSTPVIRRPRRPEPVREVYRNTCNAAIVDGRHQGQGRQDQRADQGLPVQDRQRRSVRRSGPRCSPRRPLVIHHHRLPRSRRLVHWMAICVRLGGFVEPGLQTAFDDAWQIDVAETADTVQAEVDINNHAETGPVPTPGPRTRPGAEGWTAEVLDIIVVNVGIDHHEIAGVVRLVPPCRSGATSWTPPTTTVASNCDDDLAHGPDPPSRPYRGAANALPSAGVQPWSEVIGIQATWSRAPRREHREFFAHQAGPTRRWSRHDRRTDPFEARDRNPGGGRKKKRRPAATGEQDHDQRRRVRAARRRASPTTCKTRAAENRPAGRRATPPRSGIRSATRAAA